VHQVGHWLRFYHIYCHHTFLVIWRTALVFCYLTLPDTRWRNHRWQIPKASVSNCAVCSCHKVHICAIFHTNVYRCLSLTTSHIIHFLVLKIIMIRFLVWRHNSNVGRLVQEDTSELLVRGSTTLRIHRATTVIASWYAGRTCKNKSVVHLPQLLHFFIVCPLVTNSAAGRIVQPGGPRVGDLCLSVLFGNNTKTNLKRRCVYVSFNFKPASFFNVTQNSVPTSQ